MSRGGDGQRRDAGGGSAEREQFARRAKWTAVLRPDLGLVDRRQRRRSRLRSGERRGREVRFGRREESLEALGGDCKVQRQSGRGGAQGQVGRRGGMPEG